MTNSDFRLHVGYFDHPKIVKLERRVGEGAVLAHIKLMSRAAVDRPNGILSNMDIEDIAIMSKYKGDADAFVQTLVDLRLLDVDGDTYALHNWDKHNPWAAGATERSEKARQAANARWNAEKQQADPVIPINAPQNPPMPPAQLANASADAQSCYEHKSALPPAPLSNAPILSYPSPILSHPIHTNPSYPSPDASSAQNAEPDAPLGPLDGLTTDGQIKNLSDFDGLSAEGASALSADALYQRFQNAPSGPLWQEHLDAIVRRGTKRRSSISVYLRPAILQILTGEVTAPDVPPLSKPPPATVAERVLEREKAYQNRVVEKPKEKRAIPADWLPGLCENEAREWVQKGNEAAATLAQTPKAAVPDESTRDMARTLWRDANPTAPPMPWEGEKGQGPLPMVRPKMPLPPDETKRNVAPATDEEFTIDEEKRKALDTLPQEISEEISESLAYSAPNDSAKSEAA